VRRLLKPLKQLTIAAALMVAAPLIGCATGRIAIDYDRDVDFGAFETYAWVEAPREGDPNPIVDDNALLEKRVRRAVDARLQAKGLRQTTVEEAAITIHYHVMLDQRQVLLTTNDYEVYAGGNVAVVERTDLVSFTQGTFILDIHDRASAELIWRGIARGVVDDALTDTERLDEIIEDAVEAILKRYPPP
jgi:hypothetical protein